MPIYKDPRGRYVVDFTAQGRRIFRRCPKGATQAQAKQYEAQLRGSLWNQKLGLAPRYPLISALEHYIGKLKGTRSEGKAESAAYRLFDYAKGKAMEDAPAVAEAFIQGSRGKYAIASINRALAALKRSCSLAYKAGWLTTPVQDKISLLPGEVKRTVWLTPDEVKTLVDCAKYQRTKDLILLLAYTGLRLGELQTLRKEDVRGGVIHVSTGKTDEMRTIPVHPAIRQAVKRLPITGSQRTLQQSFEWARKKAGMRHVRLHDLRHTFGSWLAQNEVQLPTIMELMGHKSPSTAKRYLHLSSEAKKKAIRRLA